LQDQAAPRLIQDQAKSPITGFIESVVPSRLNTGAKLFLTGALVNGVSNGIFNSVMQLYLISLGFSAVELGKMAMFNPLACVLLSIPCGIAADRYGKRKMILLGLSSVAIGITAFLFAGSLSWFALAFFMFGISNAAATVLTPLYSSFYKKDDMEKAFGLYGLLNISAMSLGSLAGYIPVYLVSNMVFTELASYRVIMIFASILFVAQYVFYLASSKGAEEKLSEGFHFKLKSWRPVLKFSALALFGNIAGGMLFALFPFYVNQKFGVTSAGLGALFFMSNLSMALSKGVAASVAKQLGNMKSIVVGLALSSMFFFLMPLSPSFGLLSLLYVLRSGTRFMSDPILTSLFMKSINEDELSTANSVRMISLNGGGVVSPWLGGLLMENVGLDFPAYLGAGLTVVLAGLYPLLLSREIKESSGV
jgi:DHA1 family multidrug resistance protein-like MFS transporter